VTVIPFPGTNRPKWDPCHVCGGGLTAHQRNTHHSCRGVDVGTCACRDPDAGTNDEYRDWVATNVEPVTGPVPATECPIHGEDE
jgi:hypothetical protein